jgi:metal-sulfur cluster biosynthetic enzyme
MTEETTVPSTTKVDPANSSCCSHSAPPAVNSLPVASDCCSHDGAACASDGIPVEETAPVDDAALIEALREVIDPELMINIVDLGLVYSINHTDRKVFVEMTLTSPACPAGPQIIMQSKMSLEKLPGVETAEIKLTMSPPWTPARMTDEARDQLGIF